MKQSVASSQGLLEMTRQGGWPFDAWGARRSAQAHVAVSLGGFAILSAKSVPSEEQAAGEPSADHIAANPPNRGQLTPKSGVC